MPVPRVTEATQADCRVAQTGVSTTMTRPPVQTLATRSSRPPRADAWPPLSRPNYISQDEEDDDPPPEQQTTRSAARSIMQEAMLACVDIYRPEYTLSEDLGLLNYTSNPIKPTEKFMVTPQQMSMRRLPMATSQVDTLLWKRNWMPSPGHAWSQHQHKHHYLLSLSGRIRYQQQSQGHDLWPHHMPCST